MSTQFNVLEAYATRWTQPEPIWLKQCRLNTQLTQPAPHMLSDRAVGQFLTLMVQLTRARRVLDIGTFTGYSAMALAAGLPPEGQVITCDRNTPALALARNHVKNSPFSHQIHYLVGQAEETLNALSPPFDLIFVDANKRSYDLYYEHSLRLLRPGGVLILDNMLFGGGVLNPQRAAAQAIDDLNQKIHADTRVHNTLLSVRDGLQVMIKQ